VDGSIAEHKDQKEEMQTLKKDRSVKLKYSSLKTNLQLLTLSHHLITCF